MDASFEPASKTVRYKGIWNSRHEARPSHICPATTRHQNIDYCRMSIYLHCKEDEVEDLGKMVVAIEHPWVEQAVEGKLPLGLRHRHCITKLL